MATLHARSTELGLQKMLCEPEMLAAVEPDVHLVATLLSLNRVLPNKTRATARAVVAKVVEELEKKLATPMRQAVSGSLNRSARNRRPRHQDIDWLRTIRAKMLELRAGLPTTAAEKQNQPNEMKGAKESKELLPRASVPVHQPARGPSGPPSGHVDAGDDHIYII